VTTIATTATRFATGVSYAAPPAGSLAVVKNGTTYYLNCNTRFRPMYGANGEHYQMVAAPQTLPAAAARCRGRIHGAKSPTPCPQHCHPPSSRVCRRCLAGSDDGALIAV
jgi:hypothetical protein